MAVWVLCTPGYECGVVDLLKVIPEPQLRLTVRLHTFIVFTIETSKNIIMRKLMNFNEEWQRELLKALGLIIVFLFVIIGVRNCDISDPTDGDEEYEQSIGRQILMEKYGMKDAAKREQQMRRDYRKRKYGR